MGRSSQTSSGTHSMGVSALEVSHDRESTAYGRPTDGGKGVPFKAWFEQIHYLVLFTTTGFLLCLLLVFLAAYYRTSNDPHVSTGYVSVIVGSLSTIGSGLLLLSGLVHYYRGKKVPPSFQLVYANAFADVILSVHFIIVGTMAIQATEPDDIGCYTISFLAQVGGHAGALWTTIICINLMLMLISPITYGRRQEEYFPMYHAIVWVIAIGIWVIAAADGGVGMSPIDSCWLTGPWAMVSVLAGAITTLAILVLVTYCLYKAYMYPRMRSTLYTLARQCILLGVTYVLINSVHAWAMFQVTLFGRVQHTLMHMQAFAISSTGFMNFLIWFGFVARGIAMLAGDTESSHNNSSGLGGQSGSGNNRTSSGKQVLSSSSTPHASSSLESPSSGEVASLGIAPV